MTGMIAATGSPQSGPMRIGVPVVDIIDIDYGYHNAYHHTTQDTMDKLSPKSLEIVGDVVLQTIQYINQR